MRFLLTSAGITNSTIDNALVDLLGKPIAESSALCIPTGVQPFPGSVRASFRNAGPAERACLLSRLACFRAGVISFQCPSETTSTVPSTTLMAV